MLVVLPALTWQGLNPVDDDGDGVPDTLENGGPITLDRPLANGFPAGAVDEAGLLAYLDKTHRAYDLTTDVGPGRRASGRRSGAHRRDPRWERSAGCQARLRRRCGRTSQTAAT